jgi:hypothetical protein
MAHPAELYKAECQRLGFQGGFVSMPSGPGFVHVSEHPERDWERIAPHALYDARTYAAWQTPDQRSAMHVEAQSLDDIKRSGVYRVVTPDQCVQLAQETGRVILHPLMGGMPPELGWEGLRLFSWCCRASKRERPRRLSEIRRPMPPISTVACDVLRTRATAAGAPLRRHLDLVVGELAQCFAPDATVCYSPA